MSTEIEVNICFVSECGMLSLIIKLVFITKINEQAKKKKKKKTAVENQESL